MRSRDARVNLADALAVAEAIRAFVKGETLESYLADLKLRSAVERQFEIIGEAMSQVRNAEPELMASIPYAHAVIGFRNQLIHGYALVDDEIVWGNIDRLPELEAALRLALAQHAAGGSR
jgi:uncharacterized protein with HEPN domain